MHMKLFPYIQNAFREFKRKLKNKIDGAYHQFLLLPDALFAEEDNSRLEDEAHRMQLQTLLDLTQEFGNVQPLHATIVQQFSRTQVYMLQHQEVKLLRVSNQGLDSLACLCNIYFEERNNSIAKRMLIREEIISI